MMLRLIMQVVIWSEAAAGIILNIFVVRLISKLADNALLHYKFCLTFSATLAILCSISHIVCVVTHIVDYDANYSALHGLVLFMPNWAVDISITAWIFLTVFSWTTVPAAFMLQYMIIVRHSLPTWRIISLIYLICLGISTPIFVTFPETRPLPSFSALVEPTVRSMYSLSQTDRVIVYGGTLFPRAENGNRTLVLYTFVGIGLTFLVAYGIVLFCVRGILKAIREQTANNASRSDRSLKMQRRFVTVLMMEATIPFLFLGVTVGVFTLASIAGVQLGLGALVMSVFIAVVPAIQAILYIWHLRGSTVKNSKATTVSALATTTTHAIGRSRGPSPSPSNVDVHE